MLNLNTRASYFLSGKMKNYYIKFWCNKRWNGNHSIQAHLNQDKKYIWYRLETKVYWLIVPTVLLLVSLLGWVQSFPGWLAGSWPRTLQNKGKQSSVMTNNRKKIVTIFLFVFQLTREAEEKIKKSRLLIEEMLSQNKGNNLHQS